jgi:cell division protein FtsW (lipid II flippase)
VTPRKPPASWSAFILFYAATLIIIAVLDSANGVLNTPNSLLRWRYLGTQAGLLTVGVAAFAFIGWRMPKLKAEQGVLLAFTVGVLTIVPAVLMSLPQTVGFWRTYFSIAAGMAAASFMGLLFVRLAGRFTSKDDESPN